MHLIVLNGLGEWLHIDRLIQLVFVQQVDEEVQGAFMNAHLRVQRAHLLVDLYTALRQSSGKQTHSEGCSSRCSKNCILESLKRV